MEKLHPQTTNSLDGLLIEDNTVNGSLITYTNILQPVNVNVLIYEDETIWHQLLSHSKAEKILKFAQSRVGIILAILFVIMYSFGLFTFDSNLLGNISIIYSMVIIVPWGIMVILWFGTLNYKICKKIMSSFTYWYKMYNIIVTNIMSIIWAYYNISFNNKQFLTSKELWFSIYGAYFFINIIVTSLGCLLDASNWNLTLKKILPLCLGLYFLHSYWYWHFTMNNDNTYFIIHFGKQTKQWRVADVAANCDLNASLFLFNQAWNAFWRPNRINLFSPNAIMQWLYLLVYAQCICCLTILFLIE